MELLQNLPEIEFIINVFLLFFLVLTALAVINTKNLITSTILLSVFSLLMAAEYMVLGAADVAITEAAVGAGISTILILLALFRVGDMEKKKKVHLLLPLCVVVVVSAGLIYATFDMPAFASHYTPSQIHVAPYYIENSAIETGIPNIVTSILASYRGYDTLGETVVILTAAFAVMLLLGRFVKKEDGADE